MDEPAQPGGLEKSRLKALAIVTARALAIVLNIIFIALVPVPTFGIIAYIFFVLRNLPMSSTALALV